MLRSSFLIDDSAHIKDEKTYFEEREKSPSELCAKQAKGRPPKARRSLCAKKKKGSSKGSKATQAHVDASTMGFRVYSW